MKTKNKRLHSPAKETRKQKEDRTNRKGKKGFYRRYSVLLSAGIKFFSRMAVSPLESSSLPNMSIIKVEIEVKYVSACS